ncbi:MAG: FAD-dependent oxidoreductase [Rhizomicrobium sp.]
MIGSIAIIGAGLAGTVAAQTLRADGYDGQILLIGNEGVAPYDRPSLSKTVLAGELADPPRLIDDGWLENAGVEFLPGNPVVDLDPANGKITLHRGHGFHADRILIATGARARVLRGGAALTGVHYLRNLADNRSLAAAMARARTMVVIGGGLIGCEVATTARKLGLSVTVVEASDELVARVLGRSIGQQCRAWLNDLGVATITDTTVLRMIGDSDVEAVELSNGRVVPADVVLVSIGAEPETALAKRISLPCRNGIIVDATGATSAPRIFAAGDAAAWPVRDGESRSLETYLNTQEQAAIVARSMLGTPRPMPQLPLAWTEIAGRYIQVAGQFTGPGEIVERTDADGIGSVSFRIHNERVVACVAIAATRSFALARRMVESELRIGAATLSDPNTSLRDLLRQEGRERRHATA